MCRSKPSSRTRAGVQGLRRCQYMWICDICAFWANLKTWNTRNVKVPFSFDSLFWLPWTLGSLSVPFFVWHLVHQSFALPSPFGELCTHKIIHLIWTIIKIKHFMNFEASNWYLFGLVGSCVILYGQWSCMLFVFLNVFRNFPQDGTLGLLLHGTSVVGFCSEEVADQGWPQPQSRPCSQHRVCLFRRISLISHKFVTYFHPFFARSNLLFANSTVSNSFELLAWWLQPWWRDTILRYLKDILNKRDFNCFPPKKVFSICLCIVQVWDSICVSRCITRFKCSAPMCVFFFAALLDF